MTISPVIEARSESLPPIFGAERPLHALLQHEAADLVVMRLGLGPDHEDIRDGRVRDPRLGAGEAIAPVGLHGAGLHAGGIGAGIRLGQAEAAHELARGELGQVLPALLLGAIGIDRIHDEEDCTLIMER